MVRNTTSGRVVGLYFKINAPSSRCLFAFRWLRPGSVAVMRSPSFLSSSVGFWGRRRWSAWFHGTFYKQQLWHFNKDKTTETLMDKTQTKKEINIEHLLHLCCFEAVTSRLLIHRALHVNIQLQKSLELELDRLSGFSRRRRRRWSWFETFPCECTLTPKCSIVTEASRHSRCKQNPRIHVVSSKTFDSSSEGHFTKQGEKKKKKKKFNRFLNRSSMQSKPTEQKRKRK